MRLFLALAAFAAPSAAFACAMPHYEEKQLAALMAEIDEAAVAPVAPVVVAPVVAPVAPRETPVVTAPALAPTAPKSRTAPPTSAPPIPATIAEAAPSS